MNEMWKDIKGYEGKYQVSNFGRVKSLDRFDSKGRKIKSKILQPKADKTGYIKVHLSNNGSYEYRLVHRLVAEAFVSRKNNNDNVVNHIDNNRNNNNCENLEWTTYKGNMEWASVQGRMKGSPYNFDKAHERRKKPVIATDLNGHEYLFPSQKEAGKTLGINPGHIAALCRKEYGYKQSNGYTFRYADELYQNALSPNRVKMSEDERKLLLKKRMIGNQYSKGRVLADETKKKISARISKPICQFTLNGVFVREYKSATDVRLKTGITHSEDVANGKRKSAGGYIWKWK